MPDRRRAGYRPEAADLRLSRFGDRGGAAWPDRPGRPGASAVWLAGSPAATTWRSRWRGAPAGGMWPRSWPRPVGARMSPSRLTPRSPAAASGTPRPTRPLRHLRELLAEAVPECWFPPPVILECRALLRPTTSAGRAHCLGAAHPCGVLPPGRPALGEAALRPTMTSRRCARPPRRTCRRRAAAGGHRAGHAGRAGGPSGGVAARAAAGRPEPDRGEALAARLYGVGPVTALAMTCWLAGAGRSPLPVRRPVRRAGHRRLSSDSRRARAAVRAGQAVRGGRCMSKAGKTHAAPRPPTTLLRAGQGPQGRQARRPVRGPQDPPAGLPHPGRAGDDALDRRLSPASHRPWRPILTRPAGGRAGAELTRWGTTAASSRESAVSGSRSCRAGPGGRPDRLSGRIPRRREESPIDHHVPGAAKRPRA